MIHLKTQKKHSGIIVTLPANKNPTSLPPKVHCQETINSKPLSDENSTAIQQKPAFSHIIINYFGQFEETITTYSKQNNGNPPQLAVPSEIMGSKPSLTSEIAVCTYFHHLPSHTILSTIASPGNLVALASCLLG